MFSIHLDKYLPEGLTPSVVDSVKLHSARVIPGVVGLCLKNILGDNPIINSIVENEMEIEDMIFGRNRLDEVLLLRKHIDLLKKSLKPEDEIPNKTKVKSEMPVHFDLNAKPNTASIKTEPTLHPENDRIKEKIRELEEQLGYVIKNNEHNVLSPLYIDETTNPLFNRNLVLLRFQILRAMNATNRDQVMGMLTKAYYYSRSQKLKDTLQNLIVGILERNEEKALQET